MEEPEVSLPAGRAILMRSNRVQETLAIWDGLFVVLSICRTWRGPRLPPSTQACAPRNRRNLPIQLWGLLWPWWGVLDAWNHRALAYRRKGKRHAISVSPNLGILSGIRKSEPPITLSQGLLEPCDLRLPSSKSHTPTVLENPGKIHQNHKFPQERNRSCSQGAQGTGRWA